MDNKNNLSKNLQNFSMPKLITANANAANMGKPIDLS